MGKVSILCVDDERLILDLTVSLCRELPQSPEAAGFTKAADALAYLRTHPADIALLDINMPVMDGITLAMRIKECSPDTAIIFLTGYSQYAVDAFRLHASGYLLKPVSPEQLRIETDYALSHRRQAAPPRRASHVQARTFGEFELLVDGSPVLFSRATAKELLAYLVERQGSAVTRKDVFSAIWRDRPYDRAMQKQLDVTIRSLRDTLQEYGIQDLFELKRGMLRICPEMLDCDLYRLFRGDVDTINAYRGEYMRGYPWARIADAYLEHAGDRKMADPW